jgi:hypothetical protein
MNGQKSIRIGWRSGGRKSYSHMKVNSILWDMMVESGVGRGCWNPTTITWLVRM